MTYRVKNIGIAVVLAAFAGLLTIFYVANYKRHVQHGENTVSVLVAARDIPAGTTGSEVVEQHYFTSQSVPRRSVVPGAIAKPDQLNNLVVTQQVFRGEQVTTRSFGTQTELALKRFQRFAGLPSDGVAGRATFAALRQPHHAAP